VVSASQIAAGDVHVRYRATTALTAGARDQAIALLSDEERDRWRRFRSERDRDTFALAHALLRTTLTELGDREAADWRFDTGPHGKPALATGVSSRPLSFNLSHAHGMIACAVALDAQVGVDVESLSRVSDCRRIASRYFSPREVAQIESAGEDLTTRFFELWTLKEAFIKGIGVGLSRALDATAFDLDDTGAIRGSLPVEQDPAAWRFALYAPAATHRLAVAVSDGTPRRWRIDVRAAGTGAALPPYRASKD
jgi:4'-phosphopantetheinyl transferase